MKVKMLMALVLTGALVSTVALAEPAAFQPVDDMNASVSTPSGTDAVVGSGSTTTTAPATSNSNMTNPGATDTNTAMTPSDSSSMSSEVSADTATGDDDY